MVAFPRTASLSTPEAKESSSEEKLLTRQFPGPFNHDFLALSLDPLIQRLNDHFTKKKEATKHELSLTRSVCVECAPARVCRKHKDPQCHGVDRRDAEGLLRVWWAQAINERPPSCPPSSVAQPEALTRCNPTVWPPSPWGPWN